MSKKQKRNLEAISRLDEEIVEKATQQRSNLLLALKRRIKKMWLVRGGAMAASLVLIATAVLLVVLLAKEVPVYTGMTVSNTAPVTVASVTLPSYLDPGSGNGNAYGNKHLAGDHTDADKTIGDKPFPKPIGDAVGAFHVQSAEPRYYAKPNEDVYITVHIDNPDNFVILSFTLNGQMYSSYMFEEGSDLENLILKVNVGDVEGVVSYTIDAIKYVDGTKIKDVKIGGERTVEIGVYTEKQPAAAFSDLVLGFNSISFAVDVSDTKNLFETLTGSVEAVLYDGESIVARKSISATGKTTVTFDGLATGALYECAIVATYDALDGEGIARHILSSHAAYTKSIVLFDKVEIGTTTLSFDFLWDAAFASKTITGLALYQNDAKVKDIAPAATVVTGLVPGATYTLVATYQNGGAGEQISISFTTDALFVTVNQYLEALDGTYTLLETVTETVAQGTVYTPILGSYEGFTTPTVAPMTMTDRSHVFECYFERTAYEVTFHYNSAQGIVAESIKFGKPLTPTAAPTRDGFTFGGWYLDAAFTTPAGETVPSESISVYAKWLVEASPTDFTYGINEGKVTLMGYHNENITDLVIPAYIGGYPVTAIAWHGQRLYEAGFAYKIASVTIPDTVTTIGELAFSGWRQLASITIPDSVTTIGKSAFARCSGLASITIPASVTTIGKGAFVECTSLTSVTILNTIIGDDEFALCTGLRSITIPASVTTIGDYAFEGCASLTSVTFEKRSTVLSIGCSAFFVPNPNVLPDEDSSPMEKVYVEDAADWLYLHFADYGANPMYGGNTAFYCNGQPVTEIIAHDDVTSISNYAFSGYMGLVSIRFGENSQLTTVGERAFFACRGLESVVLPSGITTVCDYAFAGCWNTSISLGENNQLTTIGKLAFSNCRSLTGIALPKAKTIGKSAFVNCWSLASVSFGENSQLTTIGELAFTSCKSLLSIAIPDSVTQIGELTFNGCTALVSVSFGENSQLTTIGDSAFDGCTSLASVEIPDSVTTIGGGAFSGCMNLASLSFDANSQLESIGDSAFGGCTSLASITIPDSVTVIEAYTFMGCTGLESITLPFVGGSLNGTRGFNYIFGYDYEYDIPASLKTVVITGGEKIVDRAFEGCSNIVSITIPDSVTSIGERAFLGCTSLESIEIPDGVTTIGDSAFSGCKSFTSIEIPDSVTSIGEGTFSGCTSLASITLPFVGESLTGTDNTKFNFIFQQNTVLPASLKTVVITGGEKIADRAFEGCSNIVSITIPDSVTTIGDYAFSGCTSLASITIPDSVTSIGANAFQNCTGITSIEIPDGVTALSGVFLDCTNLTSVSFGENSQLSTIGNFTFKNCTSLVSITIPASVTRISGKSVFRDCTSLVSVSFGVNSQLESIHADAFGGCTNLTSVDLGNTWGWYAGDQAISAADLENTAVAATYLTDTYCGFEWRRSDSESI